MKSRTRNVILAVLLAVILLSACGVAYGMFADGPALCSNCQRATPTATLDPAGMRATPDHSGQRATPTLCPSCQRPGVTATPNPLAPRLTK